VAWCGDVLQESVHDDAGLVMVGVTKFAATFCSLDRCLDTPTQFERYEWCCPNLDEASNGFLLPATPHE
jgi:hypothetical protein